MMDTYIKLSMEMSGKFSHDVSHQDLSKMNVEQFEANEEVKSLYTRSYALAVLNKYFISQCQYVADEVGICSGLCASTLADLAPHESQLPTAYPEMWYMPESPPIEELVHTLLCHAGADAASDFDAQPAQLERLVAQAIRVNIICNGGFGRLTIGPKRRDAVNVMGWQDGDALFVSLPKPDARIYVNITVGQLGDPITDITPTDMRRGLPRDFRAA